VTDNLLIQSIGLVGVFTSIFANQQKSDKVMLLLLSLGAFIFSLQFYLLDANAGAVMCFLGGTRSFIAAFYKVRWLSYVYTVIYLIAGVFVVNTWIDIIPLLGGILFSISSFILSGLKLRISIFLAFSCWLTYSIIIGSWGAIISESFQLISSAIGMYRLYLRPKNHKEKQ